MRATSTPLSVTVRLIDTCCAISCRRRRQTDWSSGTVEHGQPSLCLTCRYATIVKGQRLRDEIVECGQLGERVRFPVSSCNGYIDRTHPTIREMEDVDYVEGTKKKGLFVDLSTGI